MIRTLITAVLASSTVFTSAAIADHDSLCYSGVRRSVHGEKRLIEALSFLDEVRIHGPSRCGTYLRHANDRARRAYGQVCHPTARYYILGALEHMERYGHYFQTCDLEDAARLLNKAILIEHSAHSNVQIVPPRPPLLIPSYSTVVRPAVRPTIRPVVRPVTHHRHHGRHQGYSRGFRTRVGSRGGFGFSISF